MAKERKTKNVADIEPCHVLEKSNNYPLAHDPVRKQTNPSIALRGFSNKNVFFVLIHVTSNNCKGSSTQINSAWSQRTITAFWWSLEIFKKLNFNSHTYFSAQKYDRMINTGFPTINGEQNRNQVQGEKFFPGYFPQQMMVLKHSIEIPWNTF